VGRVRPTTETAPRGEIREGFAREYATRLPCGKKPPPSAREQRGAVGQPTRLGGGAASSHGLSPVRRGS